MFVVLKLRRWCDSGGCSPSMWFNSSFLPSKLVDIPPPVVACLNPSFHARRGARCHLKDATDAWLSPVRKHLDASVMKVCVKSYLRVKKACQSLHLKLWHETSNSAGEGHEWQHCRDVVIRSEYTVYQSLHICIFSTLSCSSFLLSSGVTAAAAPKK